MWKQALAGVVALALTGPWSVSGRGIELTTAAAQDVILTEAHIARLKNALHLNPEQFVHWRVLEATLRDAARRQAVTEDPDSGIVQRVRAKIGTMALSASSLQRVTAASRPLIATLDDDQRRDGMNAIQQMGFASLF
jgi:hypothetical protein